MFFKWLEGHTANKRKILTEEDLLRISNSMEIQWYFNPELLSLSCQWNGNSISDMWSQEHEASSPSSWLVSILSVTRHAHFFSFPRYLLLVICYSWVQLRGRFLTSFVDGGSTLCIRTLRYHHQLHVMFTTGRFLKIVDFWLLWIGGMSMSI